MIQVQWEAVARAKEDMKREKGSLTVEMTFVFSVVFFSLLMLMFMGMVLYQQVNLQSLAVRTSSRGAVIYGSRMEDMETGVKKLSDFEDRDPYRYLSSVFGGDKVNEYKSILNRYVSSHIGEKNIITGQPKNNDYTTIQDYVFIKRVKVNIKRDYHMPVDAIARMFGSDGAFYIDTTAASTVVEPVEFVRNIDLCTDVFKQTKAYDKAQQTMKKVSEYIDKFNDLLKN